MADTPQEIPRLTGKQIAVILQRNHPPDLIRAIHSITAHAEDPEWAKRTCCGLAQHATKDVRLAALQGLLKVVRRWRLGGGLVRLIIANALKDADPAVRKEAETAAATLRWPALRSCATCHFNRMRENEGLTESHRGVVTAWSFCTIRQVPIQDPWETECRNCNSANDVPEGHVYTTVHGGVLPWHGGRPPRSVHGHFVCRPCEAGIPRKEPSDIADGLTELLEEEEWLLIAEKGEPPWIELEIDENQTAHFCSAEHYLGWWSRHNVVSFVCPDCPENNKPAASANEFVEGWDGFEWLYCENSGNRERLSVLPVVGQTYTVKVWHPFSTSTGERFWIMFRPALSALNGWDEHPLEMAQSAIVQCRLVSILERTSDSAWLGIKVVDLVRLPEISRRFPPAGDLFTGKPDERVSQEESRQAEEVMPSKEEQDEREFWRCGALGYFYADHEGDLGEWTVSERIGTNWFVILKGAWDDHQNSWRIDR